MYFVHHGIVDVVSEDGDTIIETFRQGDGFGEVALIFNTPRTASVIARTDVELFAVSKHNLMRVLKCFPGLKEQIYNVATNRRQKAAQLSAVKLNMKMEDVLKEQGVDAMEMKELGELKEAAGDAEAAAEKKCGWNHFSWDRESLGIRMWKLWIAILGIVSPWAIIYQVN